MASNSTEAEISAAMDTMIEEVRFFHNHILHANEWLDRIRKNNSLHIIRIPNIQF